jgi:hypothetical protein
MVRFAAGSHFCTRRARDPFRPARRRERDVLVDHDVGLQPVAAVCVSISTIGGFVTSGGGDQIELEPRIACCQN